VHFIELRYEQVHSLEKKNKCRFAVFDPAQLLTNMDG